MGKLKPCPFCGGKAEWVLEGCVVGRIRCTDCHISQSRIQPYGPATEAWNRRSKVKTKIKPINKPISQDTLNALTAMGRKVHKEV